MPPAPSTPPTEYRSPSTVGSGCVPRSSSATSGSSRWRAGSRGADRSGEPSDGWQHSRVLDSPRSPAVRRVAALKQRSERAETGLFLVEGPQAVREALAAGTELVTAVYCTPEAHGRHADL